MEAWKIEDILMFQSSFYGRNKEIYLLNEMVFEKLDDCEES